MSNAIPLRRNQMVTSDVERIDGKLADEYLKFNVHNRPLSEKKIMQLAADMEAGRWQFNGEAIKFSLDGSLLDGQHRLHAVSLCGVPVEMLVVRGLPAESQSTMDQGLRRSASDQLNLAGIHSTNSDASAIKTFMVWQRGWLYTDKASGAITTTDVVQWATEHPEVFDLIRRGGAFNRVKARPGLVRAVFAGIAYWHGVETTSLFFQRVLDGAGLEMGSPILALRNRLDRVRGEGFKMSDREAIGYFIVAFNRWMTGSHIAKLQQPKGGWNGTNFPNVIGTTQEVLA